MAKTPPKIAKKAATKKKKLSRFCKFEAAQIHRSRLTNAPYNPNTMDNHAAAKLGKSISRYGLVEGIVWNKRTGNIVGGHHRVERLDMLEKGQDYELIVCQIDVDEKTEKKINITLNNDSLQGEWDPDALERCLKDIGDIGSVGFDPIDLNFILPDGALDGIAGVQVRADEEIGDGLEEMSAATQAIKDRKKALRKENNEANRGDFYLVAVFQSGKQYDEFLTKSELRPSSDFIDGRIMAEKMGIELTES